MKIFLAGVEQQDSYKVVGEKKIKNAFLSYYYLRKNTTPEKMSFFRNNLELIILDSGAHTFFSEMAGEGLSVSVHKKKTKTKDTPDEYWEKYKSWLIKYSPFIDFFVELDIGEIVGQKKVLEWREELKALGLYHKCITVYHPDIMSWDDYISTLEDSQSKYVALEGDRPQKRSRLPYLKLIKECYTRGIKVHGFAMTKVSVVETYPFYSVDSTSWKAGCQYGSAKVMTNSGLKNIKFKSKKAMFSVQGDNLLDIHNTDEKHLSRYKNFELTARSYNEWQNKITALWLKRGINWKD